jgi:formate dehydrogenase iron-sulfur subunit
VPALFRAGFLRGGEHPLGLGPVDALPFLERQSRIITSRLGLADPRDLDARVEHGGFQGVARALSMTRDEVASVVASTGWLAGQGDGPAGATILRCAGADEGGPTSVDHLLLESDPYAVIEGLTVAGLAAGAAGGRIVLPPDWHAARAVLEPALEVARRRAWIGADLRWTGRAFDIEIEAAERGQAPDAALDPATAASIAAAASGAGAPTILVVLAGRVARTGLVEIPEGNTLRTVIDEIGGGSPAGATLTSVRVGGRSFGLADPALDEPLSFEALAAFGAVRRHGNTIVVE